MSESAVPALLPSLKPLAAAADFESLAKLCARALKARRLHASAPGATGYEGSDDVADGWALVDGGNFVLHVLTAPARRALDLERLWGAPGRALADALPADAETLSAEEFERAAGARGRSATRSATASSGRAETGPRAAAIARKAHGRARRRALAASTRAVSLLSESACYHRHSTRSGAYWYLVVGGMTVEM